MRDGALGVEFGQLRPQRLGRFLLAERNLVLLQRDDHPVARKHRRAGDDRRRRDAVHPHERTEADRHLPDQMIDGGLADIVGLAARLRHHGVRRAREHHRRGQLLRLQDLRDGLGEHEVAGDVDVQRFGPRRLGHRARQIGAWINRGGVDEHVDAAELQHGRAERRVDALTRREIDGARQPHVRG